MTHFQNRNQLRVTCLKLQQLLAAIDFFQHSVLIFSGADESWKPNLQPDWTPSFAGTGRLTQNQGTFLREWADRVSAFNEPIHLLLIGMQLIEAPREPLRARLIHGCNLTLLARS